MTVKIKRVKPKDISADNLSAVKHTAVIETEGFATALDKARWRKQQRLDSRDALNKKLGRKKGGIAK